MKNIWFRIIAVLEMVGGCFGILFMLYVAVASEFAFGVMVVVPVCLAFFVSSLVAGVLLLRGSEIGRKMSIIVQLIQLPKIASPVFTFMFSFGFDLFPHLTVMNGFSMMGVQFRVLADAQLAINTEGTPILLGISITAIMALIKLLMHNRELEPDDAASASDLPPAPDEYLHLSSESDSH